MRILWEKRHATVADVVQAVNHPRQPVYNTVLTTLRILEGKGYVAHEKQGRAFVYKPVLEEHDARRNALLYVLSRFFENSPELLVLNVLQNASDDPVQLKRLCRLVEESRGGAGE